MRTTYGSISLRSSRPR